MNEFKKAHWTADDKKVRLDIEFCKVNKQKRLVSGWATLDNVDTENDVVTAEASLDAFERSRRNLREMHKKDSAVGRIVSFKEDEFRAPDGQKYRGVFVTARVSEGAEDTWKKVLDGTLQGFSIGGDIVKSEEIFEKSGEPIRKITKYNLNELSLVDNPGNQYADIKNIFKIRKSADGSVTSVSGMIEEHKVYNVFFCKSDQITQEKPDDTYHCPVCTEKMEVIGFIEDGSDRSEKVKSVVTKYLGGDNEMTIRKAKDSVVDPDKDESEATGHDKGDPTEVPYQEGPTDDDDVEEVEKSHVEDDVEEVHDEETEISKQFAGLQASITKILDDNKTETAEKIEQLTKVVNETREILDNKISDLDKKIAQVDNNLEAVKSRQSSFEKQLDVVNSSSAFKKSVDSEESPETVQKSDSTWNGAFSVNNLLR